MKNVLMILGSLLLSVVLISKSCAEEAKKNTLGEVKTSGVMYINYIYDINDLGKGEGFNRFDLERTYLNFESNIAEKAKIKVTTDIYQNTKSVSIKAEDGSKPDETDVKTTSIASYYDGWSVRLKNAYVDLDLIPMTTIRAGMIGTPWIPIVEKAWCYRFVKPTLTDAEKLFSSADMGAAAIVKIPDGYGEVMLAVLNGVGYSKPEDDKYKDICPRITINPLPKNLGTIINSFERILLPEMNLGQMKLYLQSQFMKPIIGLNKVQGNTFTAKEIQEKIEELLNVKVGE